MAATTTDRPDLDVEGTVAPELEEVFREGGSSGDTPRATPEAQPPEEDIEIQVRPIIAAALATIAAGLVTGGIFGSWFARGVGLVAALFGAGWAYLALRSRTKTNLYVYSLVPAALGIGMLLLPLPPGGGTPNELPQLMREAIDSGRLFRPPVPFDPGWRPLLMVVFALLAFAAAWVGTALERPKMAIVVPMPILALTAITQPDNGEFIAGLCAFVPLLAALAVLFGGDTVKASELGKEFELKRAMRGVAAGIAAVLALVLLSNASFLFPEPAYDPSDKPQKPKPIPLSEIADVVLFEVKTDSGITGPWKTGVLDVYEENAWKLPPFDKERFVPLPADGIVNPTLNATATNRIDITLRQMGNTTIYPATATAARLEKASEFPIFYDPRSENFRVLEGRVPENVSYAVFLPPYPDAKALEAAPPPVGDFTQYLDMPPPPGSVRRLLEAAPASPPWARLDFVRKRLQEVAVAVGGGVPKDITPKRIDEILEGNHEASPYELVAAEAMLARWAGVPARIGFGFDGLNDEEGIMTVRPKNAAQWLEAYFEGHGWVPLIGAPPKAKAELNPDEAVENSALPSDEVAAELYVPIKVENFKLLYQRIREKLLQALPFVLLLLAAYLGWPAMQKAWRRRKRRRWAAALGARAQIAVEYAEFRDLAHDLNVGDPYDTSLEYLKKVAEDAEHQELAWLVARSMYGDLAQVVTDADAHAAEELAGSLKRRMFRAQPFQARVLAVLSKASLRQPYTLEVPTVKQFDPVRRIQNRLKASRLARKRRRSLRRIPILRRLPRIPALLWRR